MAMTFLKGWLVFCGGVGTAWLLVQTFVWAAIHYNLAPAAIMCLIAVYIPFLAIVLYVVFGKLMFWACDCEI